jgi:AraC family transcriptional regulator
MKRYSTGLAYRYTLLPEVSLRVSRPGASEGSIISIPDEGSIIQNKNLKEQRGNPTQRKRLMRESLETENAPGLAAIDAYVRGFSTRLSSSDKLRWDGVYLEHHRKFPAERSESLSPQHVVVLFTDHVSRGESVLATEHRLSYSYPPGTINLFPVGPIGTCVTVTDATTVVCALDPKLLSEAGDDPGMPPLGDFRSIKGIRDRSLEGILHLLAAEADSGGMSGRLYADHLAHALVIRYRQLAGGTAVPGSSRSGKMPGRVLERVLDRMKADFASDLDLKTIAAESGYSRSHFLRTFRASMGYSPHQWLTRLRVEEAKALLQNASSSLTDIALQCGFSSHAHFSGMFRQIVGVVPSEYRRNSKVTYA